MSRGFQFIRVSAGILLSVIAGAAVADALSLPAGDSGAQAPASLPHKGQTMQSVIRQFGEPAMRHPAAGGDSAVHPPITRWDYAGFSVFFEHNHVVDAVAPSQPPQLYHEDQLQPGG